MSAPEIHVELERICKRYGTRDILRDADLSVRRGEFLVVLGPSGSGKSTLLKIVGGLERADSGHVRHEGRALDGLVERELARFRRRSLGFVFQFFNLVPTLTVAENVRLPLALNRHDAAHQTRETLRVLAELGVEHCADRFPDALSGGEQQRVAIARALVHEPRLVIADEPTGNLDDVTAARTLDWLEASCARRATTLIVASHSRAVAERAHRRLRIAHGRLEAAS